MIRSSEGIRIVWIENTIANASHRDRKARWCSDHYLSDTVIPSQSLTSFSNESNNDMISSPFLQYLGVGHNNKELLSGASQCIAFMIFLNT